MVNARAHRGRKSGNLHRTPILAFPIIEGFDFALTYGRNVDWVKNLLAGGSGFYGIMGL
jgi:hypothetical protein